MFLTAPTGAPAGRQAYPSFVALSGNRMFVAYGFIPSTGHPRLGFNILQDATGTACQTQADAAIAAQNANRTVFVQRADAATWPWPYARRAVTVASTDTIASRAAAMASAVVCGGSPIVIKKAGVTLDQSLTFAAAGVVNGDRLTISAGTPRALKVGFADFDDQPALHRIQSWDTACDSAFALDVNQRSVALDVPLTAGRQITSVSLRDNDASTTLTAADYHVWTSADGHAWTEVTGWTLGATIAGTHLTHTIGGLALTQRYVKVNVPTPNSPWDFGILSSRTDVNVTTSP
jgi:hypothetical protein